MEINLERNTSCGDERLSSHRRSVVGTNQPEFETERPKIAACFLKHLEIGVIGNPGTRGRLGANVATIVFSRCSNCWYTVWVRQQESTINLIHGAKCQVVFNTFLDLIVTPFMNNFGCTYVQVDKDVPDIWWNLVQPSSLSTIHQPNFLSDL